MPTPFPGMDPYLEHPALWPDMHNRLIAALADAMTPLVAPRYYVGLERRAYLLKPDDLVLIGVLDVDVPMAEEVGETFLEVHEVANGRLVTLLELLSPVNKLSTQGRDDYERKRLAVFRSRTNLVEVDLLRAGEPMPVVGGPAAGDYRILVSRGESRPRSQLYPFGLRDPIPPFPLPLLPGDPEPAIDLGAVLHALYDRARFDLRLDYARPPVPPLDEPDAAWARGLLAR